MLTCYLADLDFRNSLCECVFGGWAETPCVSVEVPETLPNQLQQGGDPGGV